MRISPVNLMPFKAMVVLSDKREVKKASPAKQDTVDITKKVEIGPDGAKTITERTKEGVLARVETEQPNGASVFEEYREDGTTVYRHGVFESDGHKTITLYYPEGQKPENIIEINPDGTSISKIYSPTGRLTGQEKTEKDGSKTIVEFPPNGGKKLTRANKYNDRTETYFDVQDNVQYEFDIFGSKLTRMRIYEPLGTYTETTFLKDGSFEVKKGTAEKVQIAGTTIYNSPDGARDFVIKNPDGSLTLESFDEAGLPIGEIAEHQGA